MEALEALDFGQARRHCGELEWYAFLGLKVVRPIGLKESCETQNLCNVLWDLSSKWSWLYDFMYHTTAEQVHHCWASVVWLILKTLSRSCSQPRLVWHLSMLFHLAWGPIPHNQVVVTLAAIWQPKQCWCWRCLQKVSRTSWKPKEGGTRATAELSHRTPLQHHNWCSLAFQIKTL